MSNISPTSFDTGPKEDAVVTDVYDKVDTSKPLNRITAEVKNTALTIQDDISSVARDAVDSVTDAFKTITDPKEIVKAVKAGKLDKSLLNGIPTSKEEAMGILKGISDRALGSIVSLENLKGEFLTDILASIGFKNNAKELANGILGLPGSTSPIEALANTDPKLKIIFNAVETVKNTGDKESAAGIASMINAITGNSELAKVLDIESQFAVMNTVMAKSYEYNIPGLADTFMNKATTDVEKRKLAIMFGQKAFPNANFDTMNTVLNAVEKQSIPALFPKAVPQVLKGYKFLPAQQGSNHTQLMDLANAFIEMLERIDTHWYQYERNGVWITNLEVYKDASEDAVTVLSMIDIHRLNLIVAKLFQTEDMIVATKKLLPKAAI